MPTIGWAELIILAVLTIVVVGPRDLPRVMRTVGQWVGRARRLAGEFQASFDEMARQTELDDLKKEVERLKREADPGGTGIDPTTGKPAARAHKRADIGGASSAAAAAGGAAAAQSAKAATGASTEVDEASEEGYEGEDDEYEDDLVERLAAEVEPETLADYERREGEIENQAAIERGRAAPGATPTGGATSGADGDDGVEVGESGAKYAGGRGGPA